MSVLKRGAQQHSKGLLIALALAPTALATTAHSSPPGRLECPSKVPSFVAGGVAWGVELGYLTNVLVETIDTSGPRVTCRYTDTDIHTFPGRECVVLPGAWKVQVHRIGDRMARQICTIAHGAGEGQCIVACK
jgi:hypothetical protein